MVDYKVLIQIINLIIIKTDIHEYSRISNIIFFANYYHLRKYGKFMYGDPQYAIVNMIMFSKPIVNIMHINGWFYDKKGEITEYMKKYIKFQDCKLVSINGIDEDEFSESRFEALDFSINLFSKLSEDDFKLLIRLYPIYYRNVNNEKFNNFYFFKNPRKDIVYLINNLIGNDPFYVENDKICTFNMNRKGKFTYE